MTGNDLSVYIHIPFCSRICPYCNFSVVKDSHKFEKQKYIEKVLEEIEDYDELLSSSSLVAIYFGGGTPSTLHPSMLQKCIDAIVNRCAFTSKNLEVTIEINPESIHSDYILQLANTSINRASIGVQSFSDTELRELKRAHSAKQALRSIESVAKIISNISIDLMYETPMQTQATAAITARTLPSLPISHISLYNMTIDPGSSFYTVKKRIRPTIPNEDQSAHIAAMLECGIQAARLKQYELSAYSLPGCEAVHNKRYWQNKNTLGIGVSSWSFIDGKRYQNTPMYDRYLMASAESRITYTETLQPAKFLREKIAIGLRLFEGVKKVELHDEYYSLSAVEQNQLQDAIQALMHEKLITQAVDTLCLTPKGKAFYDDVGSALI